MHVQAPTAMTLASLPAVLLQLILQPLTNVERILAARCSKSLLATASHPISWLHAESPWQYASCFAPERVTAIRSSLMRLAPFSVKVRFIPAWEAQPEDPDAWMRLPLLTRLHLLNNVPTHCARIIARRAECDWLLNLRELILSPDHIDVVTLCAHMPQLTSLDCSLEEDDNGARLVSLADAPALSSVRVQAMCPDAMLPLSKSCKLQSVYLDTPRFSEGSFMRLFALPTLATLTELTLDKFIAVAAHPYTDDPDAVPTTSEELVTVWHALPLLSMLTLAECHGLDTLLKSLRTADSLRLLRIHQSAWTDEQAVDSDLSVSAMERLLSEHSLLSVILTFDANDHTEAEAAGRIYAGTDGAQAEDRAMLRAMLGLPRVSLTQFE